MMPASVKMAMMANRSGDRRSEGYRMAYEPYNGYDPRMGGETPGYGGYKRYSDGRFAPHNGKTEIEIENRFRDRRGREHYDNGRYDPMRAAYDGGSLNWREGEHMERRMPPIYEDNMDYRYNGAGYRQNDGGGRMIGFYGGEMGGGYRMDATHGSRDELAHYRSQKQGGHAGSAVIPFDRKTAHEWVKKMKNADGSTGEHWTFEQTSQVMKQRGVDCDPAEFYAAMNMLWSDYGAVAKKFGVDSMEYWSELAKAFLMDEDAMGDKLALYYEYIVK